MQVRIIAFSDNYDGYKLKGYDEIDNISELIKSLHYMKENEISLEINTENITDTDGEKYFIRDISIVFPKCGGEINPYVAVYVEEMWGGYYGMECILPWFKRKKNYSMEHF